MRENDPAGPVKKRLLSLYGSSDPQLFTQILVDYDFDQQKISTESTRVYDLRAAARLQILFADGFKKEAAIKFLQAVICHIESTGLPPAEAAVQYPDQSAAPRPNDVDPPPGVHGGETSWESVLTELQRQARRHDDPAPSQVEPARTTAHPVTPADAGDARKNESTFPTLERYDSQSAATGVGGRVRRFLPALISALAGY